MHSVVALAVVWRGLLVLAVEFNHNGSSVDLVAIHPFNRLLSVVRGLELNSSPAERPALRACGDFEVADVSKLVEVFVKSSQVDLMVQVADVDGARVVLFVLVLSILRIHLLLVVRPVIVAVVVLLVDVAVQRSPLLVLLAVVL